MATMMPAPTFEQRRKLCSASIKLVSNHHSCRRTMHLALDSPGCVVLFVRGRFSASVLLLGPGSEDKRRLQGKEKDTRGTPLTRDHALLYIFLADEDDDDGYPYEEERRCVSNPLRAWRLMDMLSFAFLKYFF